MYHIYYLKYIEYTFKQKKFQTPDIIFYIFFTSGSRAL